METTQKSGILTLQQIRDNSPCQEGWGMVFKAYGPNLKTKISLGDVAVSNGAQDALWCIGCLDPKLTSIEITNLLTSMIVRSKEYAAAARSARYAADAAAEKQKQVEDIIKMFPRLHTTNH